MDDEGKKNGLGGAYAKLHQHYFNGEVPWAGTIGSGYEHGHGNHAEGEHPSLEPQA